jgi:hypothetical protein
VRVTLAGARPWRRSIYLRSGGARVEAALEKPASLQRSGRR